LVWDEVKKPETTGEPVLKFGSGTGLSFFSGGILAG